MSEETSKNYLKYLPVIFQAEDPSNAFLGSFLKAFEKILTGADDGITLADEQYYPIAGIEELLNRVANYFDPARTPVQFLPWLAQWVALVLKDDEEWYGSDYSTKNSNPTQVIPADQPITSPNRDLIRRMVQLYQKRGTREGLLEYLQIYVGEKITISEASVAMRIGSSSTINKDTNIGEGMPFFFEVFMELASATPESLKKKRQILEEIIRREKPAHTDFKLHIQVRGGFKINERSTVGVDMIGGLID